MMDPWLAQVYGTGAGEDLEKTAQAMLLEKLAAEAQVDFSQFTPEQLQQLAAEVFAANGGQIPQVPQQGAPQGIPGQQVPGQVVFPPQAQGQQAPAAPQGTPQEMAVKEAQAKFEEADFLGRVMAHSFTQEQQKIAAEQKATEWAAKLAGANPFMKTGPTAATAKSEKTDKSGKTEKTKTAFDAMAEQRAADILRQHGIDPSQPSPAQQAQAQGQPAQGGQQAPAAQQAAPTAEQFAEALEKRAYEILDEHGYIQH